MVVCLVSGVTAQDVAGDRGSPTPEQKSVTTHCAECHEGAEAEGGFRIESLWAADADPSDVARSARHAMRRVRSRTMPPPDAEVQPSARTRVELAATFAALVPSAPGDRVATARRLSREAYVRTVRDLCGVELDSREQLPEDARIHGFDDLGDAAGMSPAQFEAYFDLAGAIAAKMQSLTPRPPVVDPDAPFAPALETFLARAFRRPPEPDEVASRQRLHDAQIANGSSEADGRVAVVRSVLASPAFLLRTEAGEADAPNRLSPHELAVRLSYLLTATMPDDELAAAAGRGELRDAAALQRHARRLLAKDGGRTFAQRFVAQWLRAVDVLAANADFRRYPEIWNHGLRPAFLEEIVQLGAEIARDDGSVLWLVDCDHAWLDARLAAHYGLPKPEGDGFVRVSLPDRRRGGVLGSGAMAMVSSYPLRTSPVLRGRWVLDQLLDAETPPPPPGAGSLPPDDGPKHGASLRAQLVAHRRDPKCASCHASIDPLGFALEPFDVLGRWRTELHGEPVDSRGELPDGTAIEGPIALKDELLRRKDELVRAFAARLATFAVGRPMLPADEPEVLRIATACSDADARFLPLLDALLASPLFLLRDPDVPLREAGGAR